MPPGGAGGLDALVVEDGGPPENDCRSSKPLDEIRGFAGASGSLSGLEAGAGIEKKAVAE